MNVLLDLRPALDGHSGVPQETRQLFAALGRTPGLSLQGLVQAGSADLGQTNAEHSQAAQVLRALAAHAASDNSSRLLALLRSGIDVWRMSGRQVPLPLHTMDTAGAEEALWQLLFAKTLPRDHFDIALHAPLRALRWPRQALYGVGMLGNLLGSERHARLDTRGVDVMIAQTPYPGEVTAGTKLIVRYHDAIPLWMPHLVHNGRLHRAIHLHALRRNMADGAWFACDSDATRAELIRAQPRLEARSVTVPAMVSLHYHHERRGPDGVAAIVNRHHMRQAPGGGGLTMVAPAPGEAPLNYLLMVSTIEPRKNHLTLLAAWEQLRASAQPKLQLFLVGSLGWRYGPILRRMTPALKAGGLHLLEGVPSDDLRLLYRHAQFTVAPSVSEGFDLPPVEAMRSGGAVLASDIPVHREVCGEGAHYFPPHAPTELAALIAALLKPEATFQREATRQVGEQRSLRYLPEQLLPQWQTLLQAVHSQR